MDTKQIVLIVAIFILAIFAASAEKWELVGTIVTGYFALANLTMKKESGNDQSIDGPGPAGQ